MRWEGPDEDEVRWKGSDEDQMRMRRMGWGSDEDEKDRMRIKKGWEGPDEDQMRMTRVRWGREDQMKMRRIGWGSDKDEKNQMRMRRIRSGWAGPDEDEKEDEMRRIRWGCDVVSWDEDEMRWDEMKRGREEGVRCHEMLVCPVQGPQPFPIGTCPLNICNPIGFYLGTLRPPTSWFAACKWWMMPVISCRLWII